MAAEKRSRKKTVELKLTLTRILDAPRTLVYAAWTRPEHLKRWSAPHGFTLPVSEGDLRPGGKWRACMVSPQGERLWLHGIYREVVPGERLVFTHVWAAVDGGPGHETLVTVRFSDIGRKTKVILTHAGLESAESRDGHRGGWGECLERLAELLADISRKKS